MEHANEKSGQRVSTRRDLAVAGGVIGATIGAALAVSRLAEHAGPPGAAGGGGGVGFAIVAGAILYLAPAGVAALRGKRNFAAIATLNLLLGWTVIGWIAALVWALTVDGY